MGHIENLVAERVPVLVSVLVVICGVLFVSALGLFNDNKAAANLIPLVGGELGNSEQRRKAYIANARDIDAKGYELHKSRAFRITSPPPPAPRQPPPPAAAAPPPPPPLYMRRLALRVLTATQGEKVVLPRHLLDEVKRLPDDQINIRKAFDKALEVKYTQMGDPKHGDFLIHLIRADLTRNLSM